MDSTKKQNRRSFINSILAAGSATGLTITSVSANPKSSRGKKIKMLTPDGKLVEVDQAVIEKATGSKKATNNEVLEWMDRKHKA